MKIVWSPLALERVEDITRYIAEDCPDAAVRWVDDLFATYRISYEVADDLLVVTVVKNVHREHVYKRS